MDPADALHEAADRPGALALLNTALAREGFEAFYAEDKQSYLRHIATKTVVSSATDPHRPFSASELKRRGQLLAYLQAICEDDLIHEVLLPLFRQVGFHRITAAGHKDKALLAIYESTKPGGYNKGCERQIVVFSLIFGFVAALIAFGLIGGRSAAGFFDGP